MHDLIFLKKIMELGLTPNQYWLLWSFQNGNFTLFQYLQNKGELKQNITSLIEKRYFISFNIENISESTVNKQMLNDLFEVNQNEFWELLSEYPLKVPGRNGGTRVLHCVDLESKENQVLKKKYEEMIKGKPDLHKHIIACLKQEVSMKKKSNFLSSMQELKTWINQRTWEKYSQLVINTPTTGVNPLRHGERLI